MDRIFDLRSDTVTRPTAAMREAMARAEVGDDCYGDDPSVQALEREVAAMLGKAAAMFVPSGTMANQLAVRLHCRPGDAIATHPGAHVRIHENASAASISGAQIMPIGGRLGYRVDDLRALVREETCGWPTVRLCWLETTIGDAGGVPWPLREPSPQRGVDAMQSIATFARAEGRAIHLDGARLWNAHVATGEPLCDLAACADTVSVCLSKGLGAPIGSLLCGSTALLEGARALRHGLGGSMRQAGVLAAAGRHAIAHHIHRLADDHRRAEQLAAAIADLPVWDVAPPATNIVIARVRPPITDAETLCARLRAAGILCYPNVFAEVRLCVHLDLDDADIVDVADRIRRTLTS